ncbi:hypothetical protein PINS_up005835 [Pythium insidiosum]|nr:hypothetical protein PINS_up005835 [Pythium insidiosum]
MTSLSTPTATRLLRHWGVVRLQLFPFLTLHDAIALLATAPCIRCDRETLETVAQRFPVTAALAQGYTSLLLDDDDSADEQSPPLTASLFSMAALLEKELLPHCYRWCSTASSQVRMEPFVMSVPASSPFENEDPWKALEQRYPQRLLASSTGALAWDAIHVDAERQAIKCELCDHLRLRRATRRRRQRSVFCRGAPVLSDSSDCSDSDSDAESEWEETSASETESDSDMDSHRGLINTASETEELKPLMPTRSSLIAKTTPAVPVHSESVCRRVLQPVKAFFARQPALMASLRCLHVRSKRATHMHGTLLLGRSPSGVLTGVALCRLEQA